MKFMGIKFGKPSQFEIDAYIQAAIASINELKADHAKAVDFQTELQKINNISNHIRFVSFYGTADWLKKYAVDKLIDEILQLHHDMHNPNILNEKKIDSLENLQTVEKEYWLLINSLPAFIYDKISEKRKEIEYWQKEKKGYRSRVTNNHKNK